MPHGENSGFQRLRVAVKIRGRRWVMTLPIVILGAALAGGPSLSPRETAVAVLFAPDEAAIEPYLLRTTREQLALLDLDVRAALLEPLRPLGALQQEEGVKVERTKG